MCTLLTCKVDTLKTISIFVFTFFVVKNQQIISSLYSRTFTMIFFLETLRIHASVLFLIMI